MAGAFVLIIGSMHLATLFLLLFTLLLCGGYAGMVLMCQIGVLPAMRDLSASAWAESWCAMDVYMGRRMPPYKGSLLLVNTITLVLLLMQHRPGLAIAASISLACSVAGLVLTVRRQLPLNARLKSLAFDGTEQELLRIREQTVAGFRARFYLAFTAFAALACGVLATPLP